MECLKDCAASCCHDVILGYMTDFQAEKMQQAGGRLEQVPIRSLPGALTWRINGPCAYLEGNQCREHGNEVLRPHDCFVLRPGTGLCLDLRKRDENRSAQMAPTLTSLA